MGLFEQGFFTASGAKTGTLVAAAMETAGINIQAEMLELVNGDKGETLAGLLFLVSIISGVIMVAVGGNYKWARYLLVGPPLFFFLTQVTNPSSGAEWQHADAAFDRAYLDQALNGVVGEGNSRQNVDVALFFQFWNVFTTAITQDLMKQLNLVGDGSHLDFLIKLDRYMSFWTHINFKDPNMLKFIRTIMVSECADYYMAKKAIVDPHVAPEHKDDYRRRLAQKESLPIFRTFAATREQNEMVWWMTTQRKPPLEIDKAYTCDDLWKSAVQQLRTEVQATIVENLNKFKGPEETLGQVLDKFLKKIGTRQNRATEQIELTEEDEGALLQAVDWVIARSMWLEMINRNRFTDYSSLEGHGGMFMTTAASGAHGGRTAGAITANSIQQFNRTEVYQSKGDYLTAALAMPHFQGIILLFLAAAYPFFAMMVVVPGRAGAMLMWMGLWAWAKLWDLGFAVVMMIDNILYALFPRGPNLAAGDIENPGRAWTRILEVDPSYSAQTYYNIIATCLFAVPIVTGVFVKAGGRELVNIIHQGWSTYATRLGTSFVSYHRSLQAQGYVKDQRMAEFREVAQALNDLTNSDKFSGDLAEYVKTYAGKEGLDALKKALEEKKTEIGKLGGRTTDVIATLADALRTQKKNQVLEGLRAYALDREYKYSTGEHAFWSSESAVAARWYTHDTAIQSYPGQAMIRSRIAQDYMNLEGVGKKAADNLTDQISDTGFGVAGGLARP